MDAHYLRGQAGKLLSLSLSLSLLAVSLAAPASAQPAPGVTPTAGAVNPELNKHPFNRRESIYSTPDSMRVLRYQSISRNKIAIAELAALVVEYERLEKDEKAGRLNEAKRRELGLKKVALYGKYDISLFMLSVPKSKMPEYLAFWPNFWRRVDEFKKNNPGIRGPGPFALPREGPLASLGNGVQSLAKSFGDSLAVQEAVAAEYFVGSDFPACRRFDNLFSSPVLKCNNYDEDLFFFQSIVSANWHSEKEMGIDTPYDGVVTHNYENYEDTYTCVFKPSGKQMFALEGTIWLRAKYEMQVCGRDSGDAHDFTSQFVRWYNLDPLTGQLQGILPPEYAIYSAGNHPSGEGVIKRYRYCLDSKNPAFERYNKVWVGSGETRLYKEPNWCDN